MLKLFRRHETGTPGCKDNRPEFDREWAKCKCPIWTQGSLHGKPIKRSLKTRNWTLASRMIIDMEAGNAQAISGSVGISEAIEAFKRDLHSRNLARPTLKKFNVLFVQLGQFCKDTGVHSPSQLDLALLNKFRQGWKDGPISASVKLGRLRSLFSFFLDHEWVRANWAKRVRPPEITDPPTLPFTDDEVRRIEQAVSAEPQTLHIRRLSGLLRVMLYTGLRVSDAADLGEGDIQDDCVAVDTQKTGVKVKIPVPPELLAQLETLRSSEGKFFRNSGAVLNTTTGNFRITIRRVTKKAGVVNVHPHRYRDTLAVRLLVKGVPIEDVSKILGHRSVRITEKSYAPWVKERQERLEENVRKAWS